MNENRLISAPVGIVADIASVLGVPSSDLGYLCSNLHGHTNKWSRFKPLVHYNHDRSYHLLEDYENGGTLYMGDGTCGLDIPYTTAISNTVASEKYFNGEMKWGYIAPEPNATQPARALDFDGYYHDAVKPISTETLPSDIWLEQAGDAQRFRIGFDVVTQGTKYNLGLDDIRFRRSDASSDNEMITNWYVGILMRKVSTPSLIQAIAQNQLGDSVFIEFDVTGDYWDGEWEMIPFLSKDPICSGLVGDEIESTYIGLDVDPFIVYIHAAGSLVYGMTHANWYNNDPTTKKVSYEGWINNQDSSEHTLTAKIYIYVTSDSTKDPIKDPNSEWEGEKDLGSFTVPAKTQITFNSNDLNAESSFEPITLNRYREDKFYWAGVAIDGNMPFEWIPFEEVAPESV